MAPRVPSCPHWYVLDVQYANTARAGFIGAVTLAAGYMLCHDDTLVVRGGRWMLVQDFLSAAGSF